MEFAGRVRRYDKTKRVLVVRLASGDERSFLLLKNTKVLVRGAESEKGIQDAALRAGATVRVLTWYRGRKVILVGPSRYYEED
jgi:hypothetical protein